MYDSVVNRPVSLSLDPIKGSIRERKGGLRSLSEAAEAEIKGLFNLHPAR